MQIEELVLFPLLGQAKSEAIIIIIITSCQRQISDRTERKGMYSLEILQDALLKS